LEDFEHQELDEVLKDLTSNQKGSLDSLDDLEFGSVAEDYLQHKNNDEQKISDDPDDSLLEQALAELDYEAESLDEDKITSEPLDGDLDDFPGLGDWLTQDKSTGQSSKQNRLQQSTDDDESVLEEIEDANFDELLNSIDIGNETNLSDADDGLDISALLSERTTDDGTAMETQEDSEDDDFLDVEALLNDSYDEENESPADKEYDLSAPLASFFGDPVEGEGIDVDDDSGFGAKLDLAHAYIEIGEHDSAIELLQDIIDNGNEQQVAEAQLALTNITD
jgi:pilus assembly protein FimV